MIGYKLTDRHMMTRGNTQWGEGVTHVAAGTGTALCSSDCIHDYASPELAAFMNPAHGDFASPVLWEGEGDDLVGDDGTKRGWRRYTTLRQVPLPQPTTEQGVEFAIRCALLVYTEATWVAWAEGWLSGTGRSGNAACAAANATANAAATYAARAAQYAADAARATTYAARAAYAAYTRTRINEIAIEVLRVPKASK